MGTGEKKFSTDEAVINITLSLKRADATNDNDKIDVERLKR